MTDRQRSGDDAHPEQLMLLAVVWQDDVPYLRARTSLGEPSVLTPVEGQRLSYRTNEMAEITCLGHIPFRKGRGDFHDCRSRPQPGSRRCERCSIVEATFSANLHHAHTRGSAELDPAIRAHLDQPNRLYLAGFRDGTIKIGTSTLSRSDKRLAEQGAWQALFVAETTNGRIVRHLEDAVTELVGVAQSVSATRKRRGLANPITDARLAEDLADTAQRVIDMVIEPAAGADVIILDEAWQHPMTNHPAVNGAIDYPLSLDRGRHRLELITAVGRHLLARQPGGDDVFVVDPAPLYGRWLELGDYGNDEIAIQDSLF